MQAGADDVTGAALLHWGWPSTYSVQAGAEEVTALLHWGWPSTYSVQAGADTALLHCGWPSLYSVQPPLLIGGLLETGGIVEEDAGADVIGALVAGFDDEGAGAGLPPWQPPMALM